MNDIAYITCDPNTSPGSLDPPTLVGNVGNLRPKAILLYSHDSQECTLNGTYQFSNIYSMTAARDSNMLFASLQSNGSLSATITVNNTNNANGTANDGSSLGAPSTDSVAKHVLYSIIGIVTLLLLIFIVTIRGGIRARRDPERYGPRAAVNGRPRQSRAKGLARAILETLPIVKFGDPEPIKPGEGDIEMEGGTLSASQHVPGVTDATTTNIEERPKTLPGTMTVDPASVQTTFPEEVASSSKPASQETELECSICTEEFTTGEDVRVLPCHHKYHPACIDPWLLNVSGTCPLWYVFPPPCPSNTNYPTSRFDLRRVQPLGAETAEGEELPPPLYDEDGTEDLNEPSTETDTSNETSSRHHHGLSRFLALRHLHTAAPEERIAALRQLREQSQQEDAASPVTAADYRPGKSTGLTSRLWDAFRIRTHTQSSSE